MNKKKLQYILRVVEDSQLFTNCVEEGGSPEGLIEALGFKELLSRLEQGEVKVEIGRLVEVAQFKLEHQLRASREALAWVRVPP